MSVFKKTVKAEQEMGLPQSKISDPSDWLDKYSTGDTFTIVKAMSSVSNLHMLKAEDGSMFVYKEVRCD